MSALTDDSPIVLVADDDPTVRILSREALEPLGVRVEEAADGSTTLTLLDEHYPHLLVLDVVMPGIDGFEVCRRVRQSKQHASIPILMMTGSHRDTLTGLPNRCLLEARFEEALARSRRHGRRVACLFLDLDRFKNVNDTLGHSAGDELLAETARRLVVCVRLEDVVARVVKPAPNPTVARFGGDEFIVLLEDVTREADAARVAQRIQKIFSRPFVVDGRNLHVSTSIGISLFPRDGDSAETLLQNADAAMYAAKDRGGASFHFFDPSLNASTLQRLSLEHELHQALEQNQFVLHYQPQFSIRDGDLTGVEALLRWNHPTRGLVFPLEFVPIAEEIGLIVDIGDWVLRQACSDWHKLYEQGREPLRLSVNISAAQFRCPEFVDSVRAALQDTAYPVEHLEIELTESVLMEDDQCTDRALQQLKQLKLKIALDDFGTGYSSLSYLKAIPHRSSEDRSILHQGSGH